MEKPYDEVFMSSMELSQYSDLIRDNRMLVDWLKFKYQADELEAWESPERHGWIIRYKRYQLQYG